VYEALTANAAAWAKTLLIITFDEHGGTYDHVDPGWGAIKPDIHQGPDGFQFDRYGVRVPTIMASPWIPEGTVFREPAGSAHPYDHCSLIAGILKWQGVDPATARLGARVAVAPTFESVLGDVKRSDVPRFNLPAGYADQGKGIVDFANAKLVSLADARIAIEQGGSVAEIEARLLAKASG
jgi:phospholipase C